MNLAYKILKTWHQLWVAPTPIWESQSVATHTTTAWSETHVRSCSAHRCALFGHPDLRTQSRIAVRAAISEWRDNLLSCMSAGCPAPEQGRLQPRGGVQRQRCASPHCQAMPFLQGAASMNTRPRHEIPRLAPKERLVTCLRDLLEGCGMEG